MFGLKDYLKEDYFKNSLKVDKQIFEEIREELKKTLFKYTIERLKNYKISDEDRKLIENIEKEYK